MKIRIDAKILVDGLKKVLNIVSPRSTLPVLNNLLLSSGNGRLAMSTTDLEVSITTHLDAEVEEEGEATLPAKKFGQIVGTLPGGPVTLKTDEKLTTTISCGQALFRLMGLDPSEFPRNPEIHEDQKLVFNKLEFAKTLRLIGYAVSHDQTRIVLNGILLSIRVGNVTTVATDGRRLALVEKILDDHDSVMDTDTVLPTKVVNELQKLLEDDGEVTIKLSDSNAEFIIDDTVIMTKLIEGTYPNYRQVIPAAFKNSLVLPRENFAEVLNRVSIVVDDSGASIKFMLEQDSLVLSASSADVGEAEEPIQVSYQGDPVTISFNPGFLREPLRSLDCDEFTMRFNDEYKPVVLLGDEGFLYVIMPMRN